MFFFFIPRTIRTFCLVALVSVLTGLHCMSVSRRILRNWVIQNWFYAYRRIPWKTETESRKKAESAGDDNWRYTKGHLNPYYTVKPLYNGHLGRKEQSGSCRQVAVVERLKQEWLYGLSAETKMAVVERWPLVEIRLLLITERRDLI